MKKILSAILIYMMILSCASVYALTSEDAISYYNILGKLSSRETGAASGYLVDFDDDGSEELVLFWESDWEILYEGDSGGYRYKNYEIYSGDELIGSGKVDSCFDLYIKTKQGEGNRKYLIKNLHNEYNGTLISYTVENGKWVEKDNYGFIYSGEEGGMIQADINGVKGSIDDFYNEAGKYEWYMDIKTGDTSVKDTISYNIGTVLDGYKDVLPAMSYAEKEALFEDLLLTFSGYDVDYRTVDDYELLEDVFIGAEVENINGLGLKKDDGYPYAKIINLDEITQKLFGRVFDGKEFGKETLPPEVEILDGYIFNDGGIWYWAYGGGRGIGTGNSYPKNLYEIGNGYYYALQKVEWINSAGEPDGEFLYSYIVKENEDGSYRLIRTYPADYILTQAELEEMINPSDWAVTELEAANKAKLVPHLDDEPFIRDSASRIQFAQLAVNLAEKVTGKKLSAAPESTFEDCADEAVLKAYRAGIINGVSENEFAPKDRLTREQLATMLWRTVDYTQKATKKEKLKAGGTLSEYIDAADVADYATEAIPSLVHNGIMKGTSQTELSPKDICSVEQSIIMIYRTYTKIK